MTVKKIKKQMTVASYNLTRDQKDFIDEQAESRGISASDVIREILKKEMTKQNEEKVS